MNTSKYWMVAIIMLSSIVVNAQISKAKTETVKISGNCGMCKTVIEKAGSLKKVASVDWNRSSHTATITYDSTKTNADEILKRIALAGYDNERFLAPDEVYANLHECCRYERASKKEISPSPAIDHSQHITTISKSQNDAPLKNVFDNYFTLKDALVKSDGKLAATQANALLAAMNKVKMDQLSKEEHAAWMKVMKGLSSDAKRIFDSKDIVGQRAYFVTLSKNMYDLVKSAGQAITVYYQFCPMANDGKGANWLSKESSIKNPYYGSSMLTCGSIQETIESK